MVSRRQAKKSPKRSRKSSRKKTADDAVPVEIEPLVSSAAECLACGEFVQAQQIAEEAVRRLPDALAGRRILGRALLAQSRAAESLVHLQMVGTAAGASREERRLLVEALHETGDLRSAMSLLGELVEEQPDDVDALNELGLCALELGRLEAAAQHLCRAFELDAAHPGVCLNFARSRRFGPGDDKAVRRMQVVAARTELDPLARSDVLFALGKVHTDMGNYADAFDFIAEANHLMQADTAFDASQHEQSIDWLIESFSPALFARTSGLGRVTERPVFIVGMPRSGTTLVEQILAAHGQIHGAGELRTLDQVARKLSRRLRAPVNYPRCVGELTAPVIRESADEYLAELDRLDPAAPRVTDKLPTNFAHLGLAAILMPGARVIHCTREPMALCVSIFEQQFAEGHQWAYDFENIALFYRSYLRLFDHWRSVLPLAILEVSYEDLVLDFEGTSRALVDLCAMERDERCIEFHRLERQVHTASNWQVRQPLYATSVDKWKRYGDKLAPLQSALRE